MRPFLLTVFFVVLLVSITYAFSMPTAYAANTPGNATVQEKVASLIPNIDRPRSTVEEKGIPILSDVVSVDLEKYTLVSEKLPQDSYLGVIPQENVRYTLDANGSKIDMLYTYANGNLRMIHVLESSGSPLVTKSSTRTVQFGNVSMQVMDVVETAKGFLSDYRSYSKSDFYAGLGVMLDGVDASENLTKVSGNMKLEVSVLKDSTIFKWMYSINGVDAPSKCVILGYQNDFLKYFIDNWGLYSIGNATVYLSEQQAIDIAVAHAKSYSWNIGSDDNIAKIINFKVANAMISQTVFASNVYVDMPRSVDPLMLYPIHHVWVGLDKFYPGNVYGFNVYVWADTGDVCYIHERVSTIDPPADLMATEDDFVVEPLNNQVLVDTVKTNSLPYTWIVFSAFAAVMLGTAPFCLLRKNLPKRSMRLGGVLLCLLTASTMLLIPVSTVGASEPTRRALIWGSESTGDTSYYGATGRKTADEIYRQRVTSNAISNYFNDDGYDTDNYQGTGSIATQIVANISDSETNYSKVAVVDFNHGVGNAFNFQGGVQDEFHYMFEDNIGTKVNGQDEILNAVYDMNISQQTTGKTFFSLINTCLSANISNTIGNYVLDPPQGWVKDAQGQPTDRARGMPFAWTHRIVNWKGFGNFSSSDHISLFGYSDPDNSPFCYIGFPWGSAALSQTITGISPIYATWLENFFWYALSFDISVNHALDQASLRNFDELFGTTDLYTGFGAQWPMWNSSTQQWEAPPYSGSTMAVYGNGNIHLYQYFVQEVVAATTYGYAWVVNEENLEGGSNDGNYATLEAYYYDSQAVIVGDMAKDTAHGDIYFYGQTNGYYSHVYVYVSSNGYNWDGIFDDYVYASSPSWISVGSRASNFKYIAIAVYNGYWDDYSFLSVDSVLVIPSPPQSEYQWIYDSTTYVYMGGIVNNHEYIQGSFYDGDCAQIYAPNYPDRADIIGTLNQEAVGGGRVEVYGYSYPEYLSDMYVYVSNNGQDWYQVGSMKTITDSSPYWIDFGTYGSTFTYVRIVGHNSGNSVRLLLDCVRIT
jgi:hypothetical protein